MRRSLLVALLASSLALPPTTAFAKPKAALPAECAPLPAVTGEALPWQPGERLSYDIDVLGAQAGKMALVALPTVGKGLSAEHPFRALAASNSFFSKVRRVRGRSTSYVRARDMHPRRYIENSVEGGVTKSADVVFTRPDEGKQVKVDYKRNNARRKSSLTYLNEAFDPVSAAYYLRAMKLEAGMPVCFDAYGIRRLWRVTGKVKGVETVKVPAGVFQAWHLEGEAVRVDNPAIRREVHVWVSDDERRLPVAALGIIDLGPARAQLTHVGQGTDRDSENDLVGEDGEPAATRPAPPPATRPATAPPATPPARQQPTLRQ